MLTGMITIVAFLVLLVTGAHIFIIFFAVGFGVTSMLIGVEPAIAMIGQTLIERSGLFPAGGVSIVFYPVMFGVLGALVSGFLTLERHTTHLRDFDPLHVSWYLFNPPLGAVMGLLMLLLYAIVNQDVLQPGAAEPMELAVVWLLCALAGMNQHAVLRHIYRLLDRLASGGK